MATSQPLTAIQIPCCICGTMITANAANQCGACLAQEYDLHSRLQRGPGGTHDIIIHQCRQCRKYQQTEKIFLPLALESPELMAVCLKAMPAMSPSAKPKLQLVDAMWVYTEPNSMRLKIRVTVRAEVHNVQIQQRVVVELKVQWKQCGDCNREYTNRTWHAVVQLRQKRTDDAPKKGLAALEMALAGNANVRKHVLKIDTCRNGFDFYFLSLPQAQMFASYLARVAPMKIKTTKKLVSTDVKSNTANMKYTVTCDLVPLCRDDLIIIHKSAKGIISGRLALVTKVSSVIHLVDASPKRAPTMEGSRAELAPDTYFKSGGEKLYQLLHSTTRMVRFVVLDVELCDGDHNDSHDNNNNDDDDPSRGYHGPIPFALADVEVARESDFGQNDETIRCVTHLGHFLQPGDVVLGYDLVNTVLSGGAEWDMDTCFQSSFVLPDVVLVKKIKDKTIEEELKYTNDDQSASIGKDKQQKSSRMTKKKERRARKHDKKTRELEESAARMGFLSEEEAYANDYDPDLEEDLKALEKELALVETDEEKEEEALPDEEEALPETAPETASNPCSIPE